MADTPPPILALVRDLMFASKITATARAINRHVQVLRDLAALPQSPDPTATLLVDLNQSGTLDAAAAWRIATGGRVVGFVSHVDADTIARAREQGIDRVLSRGAFDRLLPDLLRGDPTNELPQTGD